MIKRLITTCQAVIQKFKMTNVKIGTHNGAFHCDEVLACSMLKILPEYKDATVIRTRDPELLKTCDIVVDVGGVFDPNTHRYDHHQKTFVDSMATLNKGKWVTKLSSAGLVYAHFGKNIISQVVGTKDDTLVQRIYDKVYEKFMEEIDAVDNGIATHDGTPRYHGKYFSMNMYSSNCSNSDFEPNSFNSFIYNYYNPK